MQKLACAVLVGTAFSLFSSATTAQDTSVAPLRFTIEPQPLHEALSSWARQAGLQVIWSARQATIATVTSRRVEGQLTPQRALALLLEDSGLTYVFIDAQTVAIRPGIQRSSRRDPQSAVQPNTVSRSPAHTVASATAPTASLEEVFVTGTNIAGVAPASSIIRMTREQIEDAGISTVAEAIRATPQNFKGGQNPGVFGAGGAADGNQNLTGGSSPNLRGLGAGATLTLVDGHRLAVNGFNGGVDVSMIPLSAVERVEILTDGASAIYGSDAIAGVVNVILRKDYRGAEVRGRIGNSTGGGGAEQQYGAVLGDEWSSGSALLSYEYRDTQPLFSRDRSFGHDIPNPTAILPEQRGHAVFGRVSQDIGDAAVVFADGLYSERQQRQFIADPAFISVFDVDNQQYAFTGGAEINLNDSWSARVTGTAARDKASQAFELTAASIFIDDENIYENELKVAELIANGTLFTLRDSDVPMAIGAGYRDESFAFVNPDAPPVNHAGSRNVRYVFSEVHVPLVPTTVATGLKRLELILAGRFEEYSDFGSTTNPKAGLVYRLDDSLTVRASWGSSFRAPSFAQTVGVRQVIVDRLSTPTPSGQNQLLMTAGGNPELDAETADSWSLTLEYRSSERPLSLAGTVYAIDYDGRIVAPIESAALALANPVVYAPFIIANPSAQLQQEVIASASPGLFRNVSGSTYSPAAVAYLVHARYQNVVERKARGLDISARYRWSFERLQIDGFLNGSYLDQDEQFTATSPEVAIAGTIFNPARVQLRAGATVHMNDWSLLGAVNYISGSDNPLSATQRSVSSWTTLDAALTYAPDADGMLKGVKARLAVQNLLDRDPPFVAPDSTASIGVQYDSTNASPMGRFLSIELSKRF